MYNFYLDLFKSIAIKKIRRLISLTVLLAFEGWLSGNHKQFILTAGAAIVIFRSELAMLFGLFIIIDLYFRKTDVMS